MGIQFFLCTGPAAQTAQKQKSLTTKSPLMQDWVFRLGLMLKLTCFLCSILPCLRSLYHRILSSKFTCEISSLPQLILAGYFFKIFFLIFLWSVITILIIKKKWKNWKKLKIMICLFHQPSNPTRWIFFGEKAILEESNEPSLIKVR